MRFEKSDTSVSGRKRSGKFFIVPQDSVYFTVHFGIEFSTPDSVRENAGILTLYKVLVDVWELAVPV